MDQRVSPYYNQFMDIAMKNMGYPNWVYHRLDFYPVNKKIGYYGCVCDEYWSTGKCQLSERPSMLEDFDKFWNWLLRRHNHGF